jgi:uncharacterized damage-inducible protein DinB
MSRLVFIRHMATYNEWMNTKLYDAAQLLSHEKLVQDRKAFFGSILQTLNHLLTSDTIWLTRFATHPAGYGSLETLLKLPLPDTGDLLRFADIQSISVQRQWLDAIIVDWTHAVVDTDLDYVMHYTNTKGISSNKQFFNLLIHFFNHQTHHRGQITTLLSQEGIDVGVTDLLALIPNEPSVAAEIQ